MGIVFDFEIVWLVILVGVKFIFFLIVNMEMIKLIKRYGVVSIFGVFLFIEILMVFENGGDIIKVFFVRLGVSYIKDIWGLFFYILFFLIGGVSLDNI